MRLKRLRDLRVLNEITQKELAKQLNVSQQSLSAYEKGTRDVPLDILIRYSDFFQVSLDYLVGRDSRPKTK